jgi:phage baseplate assembly protein W
MAFNIQQINPLDLQPSVGVGVGLPFSSNQVFNTTYTTQEALKTNLISYLLTGQFERYLNPNLGAGLRAILFEQMTEDRSIEIESTVRSGIATWFPNVEILEISTQSEQDRNIFTIYLKYKVLMTNIEDQLVINFEQ